MAKFTRSWGITVSEDLNPHARAISPDRGKHTDTIAGECLQVSSRPGQALNDRSVCRLRLRTRARHCRTPQAAVFPASATVSRGRQRGWPAVARTGSPGAVGGQAPVARTSGAGKPPGAGADGHLHDRSVGSEGVGVSSEKCVAVVVPGLRLLTREGLRNQGMRLASQCNER